MNGDTVPAYTTSAGDSGRDRDAMLGIWEGNLGVGSHMANKYGWFYRDCPYGPPLVRLLYHAPTSCWAGTCAMGRRRMLWQGHEIRTGIMVDLAVLPAHRSLGPALMLQQDLLEAAGEGFDLALGFPNPKAASVFKRVGYEKLADIVRCVRVLRHAGYLRSRLPAPLVPIVAPLADMRTMARIAWTWPRRSRLRVEWSDRAVDDMDALWKDSTHGPGLLAVRDAEYVRWRFDASPLFASRHLLVRDAGDGRLLAWFTARREGSVLHLMDFWSRGAAVDGIEPLYIDALLAAAWRSGCNSISMQAATGPARMAPWASRGFVERERRPVFGRWFTTSGPPSDGRLDLHLTVGDEDE